MTDVFCRWWVLIPSSVLTLRKNSQVIGSPWYGCRAYSLTCSLSHPSANRLHCLSMGGMGWGLCSLARLACLVPAEIRNTANLNHVEKLKIIKLSWFVCFGYLLHLTATSNMSLQLATFLWFVFDDLPAFQFLCATWATSRIARPIARWCRALGINPSAWYWTKGPSVEDLHNKNFGKKNIEN